MRYTVTMSDQAQDQLAALWLTAGDRRAIAQASHTIEKELADDPHLKGQDYFGDFTLVVLPLRAHYRVNEDDRLVSILNIETV